jgi:hypothetical protein
MSSPTPKSPPVEADERQPLLAPEVESEQADVSPEDLDGSLGQPEAVVRPKKTRSKVKIASYILLTLLSAFVLAVFIKGFIDADDVEVRGDRTSGACVGLIWCRVW